MKIKNNHIAKNSIFSLIDQLLSLSINLILSIYFAKYLGATTYGKYNLSLSLVGVVAVFCNFGILPIMKRKIAKSKEKLLLYLGNAIGIKIFISTPLIFIITFFLCLMFNFTWETIFIACLVIFHSSLTSLTSYVGSAFISLHRNDLVLKINILAKSLSLFFSIYLLVNGYQLMIILLSSILISFSIFLLSVNITKSLFSRFKIKFDRLFIKKYIFLSLPLVLASAAEFINLKIDIIFIGSLLNDTQVGYYSAAYNLILGATYFPLALAKVYFPNFISYLNRERDSAFNLFYLYSFIFSVYSMICILIFITKSDWIINQIYGKEFYSASKVLQYLAFGLFVLVLNRLFNYTLIALKKDSFYLKITLTGTIMNLSLNYLLIPIYGLIGAAIATICTEFIIMFLGLIKLLVIINKK